MNCPADATRLPFPVHMKPWAVARLRATHEQLRAVFGEPHFIEDDPTRTAGGDEDNWAWELPDKQRLLIVLAVPYHDVILYCDPPVSNGVIAALSLSSQDDALEIFPEPILVP
jgi:hypothetical protein